MVADEVRTLAQRTQASTEKIRQSIEKRQNAASAATRLSDEGSSRAGDTLEQTEATGSAIRNVESAAGELDELSQGLDEMLRRFRIA